ncbi:MAG: hypothetical protein ACKO3W_11225, partial [bacterium]
MHESAANDVAAVSATPRFRRAAGRTLARGFCIAVCLAISACGGDDGRSALVDAGDAYAQAAYGRAVESARRAARSSQGIELDRARYSEGLGEWK